MPQLLLAHATPVHLSYLWDKAKLTEYLLIADNDGMLTSFSFFGPGHLPILLDPAEKMSNKTFSDFTKIQRVKLHSDHITNLTYEKDLGMFISSSLDGTIKLFEIDRLKKTRAVFYGHKKGSNGFAYNERARLMASCGIERSIYLWRPLAPETHFELEGHTATVKTIQSIRGTNEIISLDVHGTVKVWDIRHQHCLQTLYGISGELKMSCYLMDSSLEVLITASRTLSRWPVSRGGIAEQTKECRVPLSHALYNRSFRQVITVRQHDSTIHIWNVETGEFLFTVATAKLEIRKDEYLQDLADITSITLDDGHRRVLIGTHTGDKITVWNTSNGKCIRILKKKLLGSTAIDESTAPNKGKKNPVQYKVNAKIPGKDKRNISVPKQTNTYGPRANEEISAIASVLVVEPLGGEKGIHIRKLTASAGWDKKIHMWTEDEKSASLDLYLSKTIPSDSHSSHVVHNGDIRAIAFCSPCYVATGCSEGKTIVWHMTTSSVHFVHESSSTISALNWSERLKLLIVCREDGTVSFINARDGELYTHYTPSKQLVGLLSCYAVDSFETYLSAGDENGNIRVWTLGDPPEDSNMFHLVSYFEAHESMSIAAVDFVESYEWNDMFILSAGRDGYACMWTVAGIPVGYFGQEIPWVLSDSSTYYAEEGSPIIDDEQILAGCYNQEQGQPTVKAKRLLKKIYDLEATIEENLDCKLPRVGEVWQLEDIAMKKKILDGDLDESADYIIDVGTVIRVDVAVDLIVLLNGFMQIEAVPEGGKRSAPLSLFYGLKKRNEDGTPNTLRWFKNHDVSSFIGRVHRNSIGVQYKAMYARYKSQGNWFLVDTSGIAHEMVGDQDYSVQDSNQDGQKITVRRNRSMSLFRSLTKMNVRHAQPSKQAEQIPIAPFGESSFNAPIEKSSGGILDNEHSSADGPKARSIRSAEIVQKVPAPVPKAVSAPVTSRKEHLHLQARKHKWYDDYEGRDMDLLQRLQNMSRHTSDSTIPSQLEPHPPPTKKISKDEVLSVVKNRHVFHPTNRKRIFDKRLVHDTDAVPTIFRRRDLKKARQERMKDIAVMRYSLPEI